MISVSHGMLPDRNVHGVLERILCMRGQDWVAVIRSIDSSYSQDALTGALAFHHLAYQVINGNICVCIDTLQKALGQGFFTGFDEVWIVSGKPPDFDLASLPSATSDGADFSSDVPKELSRVLEQTNCILIIGDGCGLNYATISRQLQEELAKM